MKSLFVLLLLLSFSAVSDQIIWLRPDFPPGTFIDGPMKDKGYNDLTRNLFIDDLPEYSHSVQTAGYERIIELMKSDNVCIVGLYKSPQRESFIHFSEPHGIVLPNGLIIRKHDIAIFKPYLSENGIQLDALLDNKDLIGGIADGRLYKGAIDTGLSQHKRVSHLLRRSGPNVFSDLVKMLDLERIDYTFGFPVEMTYQKRLGEIKNDIAFVPVEGMNTISPSYTACSGNTWGKTVIAKVNTLLRTNRMSEKYLNAYQNWLDSDSRQLHQRLMETYFKQD